MTKIIPLFEINVGKMRIGHKTTPNFTIQSILNRSKNSLFNLESFYVGSDSFRHRLQKWLGFELPLNCPVLWIN